MQLRIVSGKTLRVVELEDVSQVVVYTDEGDPCVVAQEVDGGAIIASHAAEKDFKAQLKAVGVLCKCKIERV